MLALNHDHLLFFASLGPLAGSFALGCADSCSCRQLGSWDHSAFLPAPSTRFLLTESTGIQGTKEMLPSAFSKVTSHLVRKTNRVTGLRNGTEENTRCGTKGNFINLDYEGNWPTTQRKHQERVVFKQGSQQKFCLLHSLFTKEIVPTGHKQCPHIHLCFPIFSHARRIWLLFPRFKLSHLNYECCFLSAFKDKGLAPPNSISALLQFTSEWPLSPSS